MNNLRDRPRAGVGAGRRPDSRSRGCRSAGWRRLPVPTLAAGLASAHESLVSLCGEQACVVFPLSHISWSTADSCVPFMHRAVVARGAPAGTVPTCRPLGFPTVKCMCWGRPGSLAFTGTWTATPVRPSVRAALPGGHGHTERTGARLWGCEASRTSRAPGAQTAGERLPSLEAKPPRVSKEARSKPGNHLAAKGTRLHPRPWF